MRRPQNWKKSPTCFDKTAIFVDFSEKLNFNWWNNEGFWKRFTCNGTNFNLPLTPTLDEMSGADALAEAIGGTPPQECSTDEKVILIAVY